MVLSQGRRPALGSDQTVHTQHDCGHFLPLWTPVKKLQDPLSPPPENTNDQGHLQSQSHHDHLRIAIVETPFYIRGFAQTILQLRKQKARERNELSHTAWKWGPGWPHVAEVTTWSAGGQGRPDLRGPGSACEVGLR